MAQQSGCIFTSTARFRESVAFLNKLEAKRLPVIFSRCIAHLRESTTSVFSNSELNELLNVLSNTFSSLNDLTQFIDALNYIAETAAYYQLNVEKFKAQLALVEVLEDKIIALAHVWAQEREGYISVLRERAFGTPLVLNSIGTESHVTLSTDSRSRKKDVTTVVHLGLIDQSIVTASKVAAEKPKSEEDEDEKKDIDISHAKKLVSVELPPAELKKLYDSLELIQKQIDALTEK